MNYQEEMHQEDMARHDAIRERYALEIREMDDYNRAECEEDHAQWEADLQRDEAMGAWELPLWDFVSYADAWTHHVDFAGLTAEDNIPF